MKKKKEKWIRFTALLFAIALAIPSISYAKEESRILSKIHHIHTGNQEEGGGCYGKEIRHIHQGSEEGGGDCFSAPVYHVHQGDESGGECFQKEIRHTHKGTEEAGTGCYGKPVYHVHEGDAKVKGGCYSQPVYHKHTGSAAGKGGCYNQPIYHTHTGSQAAGGGCYGKPVYHSHSGSAASKGGCYQNAVYHVHAGNEASGGGCYEPVYHQHTDSCYREERCDMEYVGNLQTVREESGYCYHHGNVLVLHFRANFRHMACGAGTREDVNSTCWTCQYMDSWHTYKQIVCGKTEKTIERYQRICGKETNTVESWALGCGKSDSSVEQYALNCGKNGQTVVSYGLNCGKNANTVDSYKAGCGKTESSVEKYGLNCGKTLEDVDAYALSCIKNEKSIDGYRLSCEKTEETVDGYALSCGRSGEESYAEFSVSSQNTEWTGGDVVLQAAVQDTGGLLRLSENPFAWRGKGMEEVSSQEVKVKENGIYYVRLLVENEDIDKKELVLSIEVRNIDVTAPVIEGISYSGQGGRKDNRIYVTAKDIQPDGSLGSGLASEAYSFDGGKTWQKENRMEWKAEGTASIAVRDRCGNISVQDIEIKDIGKEEEKGDGEEKEEEKGDGEGKEEEKEGEEKKEEKEKEEKEDEKGNGGGQEEKKEDTGEDGTDHQGGSGNGSGKEQDGGQGAVLAKGEEEKEKEKPGEEKEPVKKRKSSPGGNEKNKGKEKGNAADGAADTEIEKIEKPQVRMPDRKKEYKEETTQAKVPETAAKPEMGNRSRMTKRMETAGKVVKAVTFTISGIMLAAGMLYLIYLMFRSIQIYDCDGEGNVKYAGSCIMKKTEDGFEVKIPDMIWEHSVTGQYSLRPGRTFVKRNKGKELAVIAGEQRTTVWIDHEIPFRTTTCV